MKVMGKIIYLPIEEIEARYTKMMNDAISPKVDIVLYPEIEIEKDIKQGQFLDIVNTCKFKAAQLQMVADLFSQGKINSGDAFFVGDIFFPGIEMIKYMAELLDLNAIIAATEGFSGAEIEHVLVEGLFSAFHENREIKTEDVLKAIQDTVPLSVTYAEELNRLREWSRNRARSADAPPPAPPSSSRASRLEVKK
ncbi:hypothetical protein EBZ37_04035 [bacterium]|nr:hypothetical protein [bacterium]